MHKEQCVFISTPQNLLAYQSTRACHVRCMLYPAHEALFAQILAHTINISQKLARTQCHVNVGELSQTYPSSATEGKFRRELFTSSMKREIRHFHAVLGQ